MSSGRLAWGAGIIFSSLACSHSETARRPVIYATPTVVTPHEDDVDLAQMFARARALLADRRNVEAAELFDHVLERADRGPYAAPSAFNSGLAWESAGNLELATARFERARQESHDDEIARDAGLHLLRLYAHDEKWEPLCEMAERLASWQGLAPLDQLLVFASKALALVETGNPDEAERWVQKGRSIIDDYRLGDGGQLPTHAAELFFTLGEIRKARGEAMRFVPLPANFAEALERRCQALLDAQSAYSDAMRSLDAHWSAMSGYRVGQLYQQLHEDVMAIPFPKAANNEKKQQLFEGAMRLRYRILLEKGLKMMDHTVMLGDRTGESSQWIDRARKAKADLEKDLSDEKETIRKLPYTERELQNALDDLGKKKSNP